MENRKRGKFTWVFIDECYLYFKYHYSGEFLYRAWKRFRKYAGIMTAATQNVEECLKSETARLMLANSEFLLLFNQSATDRTGPNCPSCCVFLIHRWATSPTPSRVTAFCGLAGRWCLSPTPSHGAPASTA